MQRESREEFESREQRVRHTARWCRISATRTLFSDERKFEEAFSSERLLYVSLGSHPESRASTSRPLLLEPLHGPSLSGDTGRESLRTVKNRSRKTKEKTSATHFPLPLPPLNHFLLCSLLFFPSSPSLPPFLSFLSPLLASPLESLAPSRCFGPVPVPLFRRSFPQPSLFLSFSSIGREKSFSSRLQSFASSLLCSGSC
ncbi:hypothetical protein TGME49_229760 [Toxoplasma gondii ME49]|uniref:Uncharacterized protein n=3 Tax=Toxoplasma gondii TaxID=5811 RepID=B6KJ87_TOXGV|nr:hypothetical protein TGME49_229760 [Toxoplasma gondii ME49]EPT29069.1 hypothetical protein TGME49_229760 [Toxoplasma gondii ME49]ESS35549.1 hypothetical protein TGVEG_229760 [Toxoplasma gondii VEG]KYF45950.1 hypothetical protein TGARI_229760 [Toxoplasma gondii ARI]CEL74729.1 TPA: hypothetical protein BN1205_025750 [Toxoplasma gondii VEG]|eukprot:XP_002367910.1 hypothetical protein TGME49_229760 [Toxoplasma gondii ME49]